MISRANIDDAVAGYIGDTLATSYSGEVGTQLSEDFGPGDIPKAGLISMRRDVQAFLKRNERLIKSASYRVRGRSGRTTDEPVLESIGWAGVGSHFAYVRNSDSVGFDDLGWGPDEITEKLDEAAWAFPRTELYLGEGDTELTFWAEKKR